MNILQVFDFLSLPHGGGTVDVVYKLSQSLSRRGHNVTICTGDYELEQDYVDALDNVDVLMHHSLLNRHGLFEEHLAQMRSKDADAGPLDAMLDLTGLHWRPTVDDKEQPDKVDWKASRSHPGWLVPLPVGYGAISPLYEPGQVKNARDNSVPCVFVESLCSIGEWRSPHRIDHPLDMLWYHRANPKSGVYICDHQPAVPATGS